MHTHTHTRKHTAAVNNNINSFSIFRTFSKMEYAPPSYTSSDGEEEDRDSLRERKYPGEVTTGTYKVKASPKDSKKEVLM